MMFSLRHPAGGRIWDYGDYLRARAVARELARQGRGRRRLRRLARRIREYREGLHAEHYISSHISPATIPLEYFYGKYFANIAECFYGDDVAKMLPYTCWFMAFKWFWETIRAVWHG